MFRLGAGPNFAVFVLFFGVALIEAARHGDWLIVAVFVALGILFLRSEVAPRS